MSINFISQLSLLDIHSRKNCINLYGKFETDGNHRVEGIEKMKVAKLFSGRYSDCILCGTLQSAWHSTIWDGNHWCGQRLREKSMDVAARIARRIF